MPFLNTHPSHRFSTSISFHNQAGAMSSRSYSEKDCDAREFTSSRKSNRLCPVCSAIDFDKYLGEPIRNPISLGSWMRIRSTYGCPFCRLVTHCLGKDPELKPRTSKSNILLTNQLSWKLGIEKSPYDLTKSDAYSNKYDLRSLVKSRNGNAYRFLIYADDTSSGNRGCIQYLAIKDPPEDRHFFG